MLHMKAEDESSKNCHPELVSGSRGSRNKFGMTFGSFVKFKVVGMIIKVSEMTSKVMLTSNIESLRYN